MSSLLLFWLLLSIPPLLAKSVGQVTAGYKEGGLEVEKGIVLTRLQADEANVPPSSVPSLSEWFLQIAHKNCLGPEGQPGTCMFNFECQKAHGQVVGACLDGFLFGACCYLATDYSTESVPALSTTQDSLEASLAKNISAMAISLNGNLSLTSLIYSRNTPGNGNKLLEPDEPNIASQIPNALILRNGSEQEINNQLAAQSPVEALAYFHTSSVGKKGEEHPESTLRVISSSATASVSGMANSVPDTWNAGILIPLSTISDNQISSLLTKTDRKPATAESVIVNKGDPTLQTQLTTLLNANMPSSSILPQELESSTFANRIPVRSKGKPTKRSRPKPTFTSTTPTSTSTSARQDNESSTTRKPPSFKNTTDLVVTESTVSVVDQQTSVLQFLVSNSPIWVLEELINGSALTTWYPLPIPDEIPESLKAQVPVDPVGLSLSSPIYSSTLVTSRPFKTTPIKSRPDISNRTSSTTAPTANKTEDQSIAINLTMASITATNVGTVGTTSSTTTTKKPRPLYDYAKDCGVRPMVPEARIVGGKRSDYGRWPWQVLIRESTWFGIFSKNKCGGVLISDRHVLTAAHCQPGFLGSLLVILGEFELAGHPEPFTPVEKHVKRVVVHRDYVERTFENDMAILELDSPVEFKPYIVPICLPSISEGDFIGKKAEVTGWGKLSHNGLTPGVLYEVDVPIISNPECHDMFKKAGHEKRILDSFVCAGYSEGKKDSCEGDSGGPLMVEGEDGRWLLVGTVSHGIRCAYPNMPGVYMRMTYYRPWIERVIGVGGIH